MTEPNKSDFPPWLRKAAILCAIIVAPFAVIAIVQANRPSHQPAPQSILAARAMPFHSPRLTNVRVVDGDTLAGDVVMRADEHEPLFWGVATESRPVQIKLANCRVRILDLDAWERTDGDRGLKAKAALTSLVEAGDQVRLLPAGDGQRDSFGRLLAWVFIDAKGRDSIDVSEWMIAHNHGVRYVRK